MLGTRKKFTISFLFVLAMVLSTQVRATHIVGGELNYKHLGSWNYEIQLTVYRDCWVGIPPFDNPAALGVFDENDNLLTYYELTFLGLDTLEPTINFACFVPPTDFCYEVTTYIDTINLPPIPGGYQLAYQRCCRNQFVLNIDNPEEVGATYYATIPDTSVVTNNSNPVFKNWPPPFLCSNTLLSFDHSAIDSDGDSLVYDLYTPFSGASYLEPKPVPPNNPPYGNVTFIAPYSQSDMLGGDLALSIDAETGLLTANPSTLGYFVIGIVCKEYRNGVLIGETKRDFQFIVKDCPTILIASTTVPNVHCGSPVVDFTNSSVGAASYKWYFGDPTVTNDSSNFVEPEYEYPSVGTYTVTMVAFSVHDPYCSDTTEAILTINDDFESTYFVTPDKCKRNQYVFNSSVKAYPDLIVKYKWSFGDSYLIEGLRNTNIPKMPIDSLNNFGNTFNSYENPIHLYPEEEGEYITQLIVSVDNSLNCNDTLSLQTVQVGQLTSLFVPNTFTPNKDGKNDIFKVRGNSFENFYFSVYDRWGELIFETTDDTMGWDGMHNGKECDPAVYAWYLRASCVGEEEVFKKGNVTLMR